MKKFILPFSEISKDDVLLVGGKNANIGEMYQQLSPLGIKVPDGFAISASAYDYFLAYNHLEEKIKEILKDLNTHDISSLKTKGKQIRELIKNGNFPNDLKEEILTAYQRLKNQAQREIQLAVRSSATAEDLPSASFAGQQETYLNVQGEEELLQRIKDCFASLFTDRAISYREDKGFDHFQVKLSVGVQRMVRSDLASSGVAFTIDPDSGFPQIIVINSIFGLGELIVQGKIIPDEFVIFKPTLEKGYYPIIKKQLGQKRQKIVYHEKGLTTLEETTEQEKNSFSLSDQEIIQLAKYCLTIEKHFGRPMDIEWAKDGLTGEIFIVQARPETVHSVKEKNYFEEYRLEQKKEPILKGIAIGNKITWGKVRIIPDISKINEFQKGEILVTEMTDPDWEPIMKIAKGIITEKGGRTAHAAIVSRELGIPAIVGVKNATKILKTGEEITLDCSSGTEGKIYKGKLKFKVIKHNLESIPKIKTKLMVNIGSPDEALEKWYLPVQGVGLAREEFIIISEIGIHPNALLYFENLPQELKKQIEEKTKGYQNKEDFYIEKLAEGISQIASAFYPKEVIVRFSDFKTNEYQHLLGGELYEPEEENPMLGWRGASRYYDDNFKSAFKLEISAIEKVREKMGLKNISVMVPFCRTPEEGKKVVEIIRTNYPAKDLKIYVMAEIPSNILLAEEFLEIFDGFSIGSNDLTQLILGIDRDNERLQKIANENNPAVKEMISKIIKIAKEKNKYIGICGQAPSDYPEFVKFLVKEGIESISVNPDAVFSTLILISQTENNY